MNGYEHRLRTLYDLGCQVVDNLGLGHQALQQALQGLLPLVDARGGALFLWEDGTPSLSQQVGLTPAEEAGLVRQVSAEGPLAQVIHEGVPLRLDHWSPDGEASESRPALLAVPLAAGPRLLGALYLVGRRGAEAADQPLPFTSEDEALARTFALTLALALENAHLQEQNQANFLQKALLYEMTTTISATLDIGQVLRMVSERLAR
ncbi:MAG: GAF domain-containing protein, partial [Chloroflexi bacterium]